MEKNDFKSQHTAAAKLRFFIQRGCIRLFLEKLVQGSRCLLNVCIILQSIQRCFLADAPFVSFNCADYAQNPQLLFDTSLGSKRGFTGAAQDSPGSLAKADGGIVLDEIQPFTAGRAGNAAYFH